MLGWLNRIVSWWRQEHVVEQPATTVVPRRLERIVLSDGVARTLFEDYADHRDSPRGDEEIGWILLGLRNDGEAIALAALPAGTQRDAGMAHIRFNSDAQALASRIVRQHDKRLQIIGVVHTHPGSLRHPSDGDYQGDSAWVRQLRGGEGTFGIGTADVRANEQSREHVQIRGGLCFSWYTLGLNDRRYRTIPVQVSVGPDLAESLRPVWDAIETHAEPLNRLCRQLAKVQFEVIDEDFSPLLPGEGPGVREEHHESRGFSLTPNPSPRRRGEKALLCVKIPLAEPNQQLRLLLSDAEARYYWDRENELIAIDPNEAQVDRAVFLILAELAKSQTAATTLMES